MKLTKELLQRLIKEELGLTHARQGYKDKFDQAMEKGREYSAAEKKALEPAMKNQLRSKAPNATPDELEKAFQIWARNYPTMKTAQDALKAAKSNLPLVGDIPR